MNINWAPYDPCPCGCGVISHKLTKALPDRGYHSDGEQHAMGCKCRRHLGKRSRKKGGESQTRGAKKLGDTGKFIASNEEAARAIEIKVQVEYKKGYKGMTVKFYDFIKTKFFERALSQATRSVRTGEGSLPGVMLDDKWLIVDVRKGVTDGEV